MSTQLANYQELNAEAGDSQVERRRLDARVQGQYQVVRELGRGGMGVVFLARDIALHRMVAIKVLRHEFVESEAHRERFRREARLTARLTHPGIVPVYTFGESKDLVYIVMQYVDGESLAERIHHAGRLSWRESMAILRDVSQALDYAHAQGLVHRDLKAENVLVERGTGRALLTDFGVARLQDASPEVWERDHAFGTPHYMSPEQAAGEPDVDRRSDVYSLGVLGYLMLSGTLPFVGNSFTALAAQHIVHTAMPLRERGVDAPEALIQAVTRCLAKERADRFATAADFGTAIARITTDTTDKTVRRVGVGRGWMRVATMFAMTIGFLGQ